MLLMIADVHQDAEETFCFSSLGCLLLWALATLAGGRHFQVRCQAADVFRGINCWRA